MPTILVGPAVLAALFLSCHPASEPAPGMADLCWFSFTDCYPVDPCESAAFSLQELLVLEGQGIYLETSEPGARVERLSVSAPAPGYTLPKALLTAQYHPVGSPHFIVIPIGDQHPFWDYFLPAATNGIVLWSGEIRYPCTLEPGQPVLGFAEGTRTGPPLLE
jgi:hypothetical protein